MKGLMKFQRSELLMAVMFVLLNSGIIYASTPWLHTDGNRIKDPNGHVVVLRGVDLIDLGFLQDWQGGAIAMIDRLTNKSDTQGSSPGWYTKVIRINITPADAAPTWPQRFNPGNNDFYNNLLRPVVDYCRSKDMYVIIDWHYVDNTYSHVTTTNEFWTYMAPRFANDSHVMFELYNEPINNTFGSDNANWQSVRTDMQTWINIVRTYAPNNIILVGGASWSQIIGPAATYPLTGNNIVIVSHIYPGHWLASPVGNNWYTGHINTCLTVYPVFMTEWGFTTTADQLLNGTITNYGAPLRDFRESRKISSSAWVASYDWAPPMFNTNWTLRVGEGEMGGFTKDMLYAYRNSDQPGVPGNIAPTVSITSPINGATFTAPANIVINASASDSDGTITQVRFYQGTTLLGSDASSPYSYTWSNVGAGSYSLTADATDNGGLTTTSVPVNITVNGGGSGNIEVRARGSIGDETIDIKANGVTVATFTLSTSLASYFANGTGTVQVHFTNDNGSRDVQIDYVVKDSTTYQSENMPINTGVWTTVCGGSYSEWLNCNGYIEYGSSVVTLLDDGFETNFDKWTDGGTTDWDRATDQKYAGIYSAHAGSADNDLISDNLNTSGKTSITIDFWFRDDDIDNSDDIYLQLYNGSTYTNFYELGNSTEDTWIHYTVTLTSSQYSQYFRTNFRIKFEGTSIDSGENLWIDTVKVTAQ